MSSKTIHLGTQPAVDAIHVPGAPSGLEVLLAMARRQGYEQGRQEALAEASEPLQRAAQVVDEIAAGAEARMSRSAAELAFTISRALLQQEIPEGRYDIEKMVRQALADSEVGRGQCTVHLNPADHERLADVAFRSGTSLQSDAGVPPGEVQVETPLGLIVRSLDEALEKLRALGYVN